MSIEGRPFSARFGWAAVLHLTVCALLAADDAVASPRPPRALTAWDKAAVERARLGAQRKLQEAECRKLFTDFEDARGRPLQKTLEEWSLAPEAYASIVTFVDGSSQPRCRGKQTALAAVPGSRRVYVCPAFAGLQLQQPLLAESMVIHEVLHTLGLGEDPPTSLQITQRVESRCR